MFNVAILATLLVASPVVLAATETANPYLNIQFSAPYIEANVSLSTNESYARVSVGGSYTLYTGGFLSTSAAVTRKTVGADVVGANFATPGLIPLISSNEYPNFHVVTATASAGWSLSKLNGTLASIVGAKGYASSIGQIALQIIEFNDTNLNDQIDANETVSVYDLHRSFGVISCNSNADAFWCNSTSTDKVFNILSTVSKNLIGRTQYGEIITPRHTQVVYTIRDFPYKATGTKIALRSLVASAVASGNVQGNFTLSGRRCITAADNDTSLQVFFGWGGQAKVIANATELSARVAGTVSAGATVGMDDKTLSGYIKGFGMADASVKIVDIVVDTSSKKAEFLRVSSAMGSGPMPIEALSAEEPYPDFPSTPSNPTTPVPVENGALSTPALIGIIVGGVALIALIATIVAIVIVRRRRNAYNRLA